MRCLEQHCLLFYGTEVCTMLSVLARFFCQLDTGQNHSGRRNPNWETVPPDWPVGRPVVHFLDWRSVWVDSITPGNMILDGRRKQLNKPWGSSQETAPSMASTSFPASRFQPCAPALTSLCDGRWVVNWNIPFPPRVAFAQCVFISAVGKQLRHWTCMLYVQNQSCSQVMGYNLSREVRNIFGS